MKMSILYNFLFVIFCVFSFSNVAVSAVFFSDDFETGDRTSPYTTDGSAWAGGNISSGCSVSVSNAISHSGNYALKFQWRAGSSSTTGGGAEQRFRFGKAKSEVYLRFYIYFPDGTESGEVKYVHRDSDSSDNNKLLRLWHDDYNYGKWGATLNRRSDNGSYISARGNVEAGCGDNDNIPDLHNIYDITANRLGEWISLEFHIKPDSGSGDGIFELWVDGVYVAGRKDITTSGSPCSPNQFLNGYLLGYSNSGFDEITNIYVDDVVFSTSYIGPSDTTATIPPAQEPSMVVGFVEEQ